MRGVFYVCQCYRNWQKQKCLYHTILSQIQHAQKLIDSPGKKTRRNNPNDPARFIEKTAVCPTGEIAKKYVYSLDEKRIQEESKYDGFYAVITNIVGNPEEILKINRRRWEIEENFRIMKSEFEARPVNEKYTCSQILKTLSCMTITRLSKTNGYVPAYKRTALTDELHELFGFRPDYEFMTQAAMRATIKDSKKLK